MGFMRFYRLLWVNGGGVMGFYGFLWVFMLPHHPTRGPSVLELLVFVAGFTTLPRSPCFYVGLWGLMGIYGNLWEFMGIYGYLWVFMGIYGYLWVFMGIYGYLWVLWVFMGIYGYYFGACRFSLK